MRGDVETLLKKLYDLYNQKYELLKIIYTGEVNKRYCLKSDNITGLLESIEQDNEIYERVSALGYDIEMLENEICRVSGIGTLHFHNELLNTKEKLFTELKALIKRIQKALADLTVERDKLIGDMEKKRNEIGFDIKFLSNLKRLTRYAPPAQKGSRIRGFKDSSGRQESM